MKLTAMFMASVAASAVLSRFTPFAANAVDLLEMLPTVEVNGPNGPVRINRSDYDANPGNYSLVNPDDADPEPAPAQVPDPAFAAPSSPPTSGTDIPPAPGAASPTTPPVGSAGLPPAATGAAAPATPAPSDATVTEGPVITKIGSGKNARQFVTDAAGNKLDGYSAEGYETVEAAQDAITAAKATA